MFYKIQNLIAPIMVAMSLGTTSPVQADEAPTTEDKITALLEELVESTRAAKKNIEEVKEALETINIGTDAPSIQDACPQLQTVELITEPLGRLPFIDLKAEHQLSILGEIKDSGNANLSREERKEVQNFQTRLLTASDINSFAITINSEGGDINRSQELIDSIYRSPAMVTAYAPHDMASAGTGLFIASDDRYLTIDTNAMVHTVTYWEEDPSSEDGVTVMAASDYPAGSEEREYLELENKYIRDSYTAKSSTGISEECVSSLFNDYVDVYIPAEDMLKLGWAEYAINWEDRTIISVDYSTAPTLP